MGFHPDSFTVVFIHPLDHFHNMRDFVCFRNQLSKLQKILSAHSPKKCAYNAAILRTVPPNVTADILCACQGSRA